MVRSDARAGIKRSLYATIDIPSLKIIQAHLWYGQVRIDSFEAPALAHVLPEDVRSRAFHQVLLSREARDEPTKQSVNAFVCNLDS